ncbi:hypothetical protein EOM86_05200 [Candidatus Nomurabacteria bacterium]|nr:hypothetical protein [Candidatus Nomurabacteria bacterium]
MKATIENPIDKSMYPSAVIPSEVSMEFIHIVNLITKETDFNKLKAALIAVDEFEILPHFKAYIGGTHIAIHQAIGGEIQKNRVILVEAGKGYIDNQ